jgi:lipopolysaccharide/colanic/teichoic acid biosynthesis glycosyltransferase
MHGLGTHTNQTGIEHIIVIDGKQMKNAINRLMDLLISIPLVIFLSPLFLFTALSIKIESSGPVFFVQKRRGKDFAPFRMIKFRSLLHNVPDPHENYEMLEKDPRITRVGNFIRKTSIDELPQLLNVIAGTMSIVGPRPLIEWESRLALSRFADRYTVKPGMTGLSQVTGRNTIDFDARCALDVEYVRKRNMLFDILLIIKTPYILLKSEEIYPMEQSRNTVGKK